MSSCDCQENIDEDPIKDASHGDGLIISTVAAITTGIFFALRALGVEQQNALLVSTSFVYGISLADALDLMIKETHTINE